MKIITLSEQDFDRFASSHRYKSIYQTSSYGKLMSRHGFKVHYIGITDDLNHLIGASLIMYKDVFMNKKIAYAPRGILFDYSNSASIDELVKKLKQVLGRQDFILLRMDPYIPATIRNQNGTISNLNKSVNATMANLKHAGFKYKGQNNYFENEKGRFESIILLNDRDIKNIYLSFSKSARHKINKASNSGVMIVKDEKKNTEFLANLLKGKDGKSKEYYSDFVKAFGNKANIYYALLDTNAFVISTKKIYEYELEKNEILATKIKESGEQNKKVKQHVLNYKMESDKLLNTYKNQLVLATELLQKYPTNIIIGGALTVEYDNSVYLIAEGFDKKYNNLCCNYLIRWFIITEAKQKNYKYFNIGNISGDFKTKNPYTNLNQNKLGFGSIPTEYIGEFDLVLDSFNYKVYQNFSKDKNFQFKNNIK